MYYLFILISVFPYSEISAVQLKPQADGLIDLKLWWWWRRKQHNISEKTNLSLYRRILCLIVLGSVVVNWCSFSNFAKKNPKMVGGPNSSNNSGLEYVLHFLGISMTHKKHNKPQADDLKQRRGRIECWRSWPQTKKKKKNICHLLSYLFFTYFISS